MSPRSAHRLATFARGSALLIPLLMACAIDERAPAANEADLGAPANAGGATAGGGAAGLAPAGGAGASSAGPGAAAAAGASSADDGAPSSGAGSGNAGGAAGGASAAGASSVGAAGEAAGGSGSAGAAPCAGCVELSVPVSGPGQAASFLFTYAEPGADFSNARVSWRVQVPEENANPGFYLTTDVQNGPSLGFAGLFENYELLTTGNFPPGQWVDLSVDVSAEPMPGSGGGFDPRAVEWVALTLGTTDDHAGEGVIRVLVDSVAFDGVAAQPRVDFTSGTEGLELNAFMVPEGTSEPVHHP